MKRLLLFCLISIPFILQAQTSFTNSNVDLGLGAHYSGVAMAVADMDGDGLDDIVRMDDNGNLYIAHQKTDGAFYQMLVSQVASDVEWSICVADVDNNGITDITTGGVYNSVKLAMANMDGTNYNVSNLPGASHFVQGSNLVDINNDGWLDHFSCNDDGESRIWGNEGNGNLIQQDSWIDMSTTPSISASGNYGSIWTDFDYDGDIDLYIAKCRSGVTDPTDPRRINVLYVNDGNGNFTEDADNYGLRITDQSWTADFADYDNDGDFDCLVTNHMAPSQLLRNDNGYFTDVTIQSGVNITVIPVQAIMEDFDNDGYQDILVAGNDEQFFHNNGDGTFTELMLFDNNGMESFAIGDLNHDGFLDIYGGYAGLYNNPSNIEDVAWLNVGNSNNFIAIDLEGTVSNRDAIGAKVEIYGEWGMQVREVRSGESYGISNSLTQHFGIGQNTAISHIIVRWPSGIVNTIYNPNPNQFLTIIEDACSIEEASISTDGDTILCPGSSLDLSAPQGYSYNWSNGESTETIAINQPGTYMLTITDSNSCASTTSILIEAASPEIPSLTIVGDKEFCLGGSVQLDATGASNYLWSNGENSESITVTESGIYSVSSMGACGEYSSESITIDVLPNPESPQAQDASTNGEEAINLTATGTYPAWYDVPVAGSPLAMGNTFTTPVITEDVTYYVEDQVIYGGEEYNTGLAAHSGASSYSPSQFNGSLVFDAMTDFTLESIRVFADISGNRTFELRDAAGTILQSQTVFVNSPTQVVELDFEITAGTAYQLATNEAENNVVFGNNSPELKRNNEGVNYPYTITDVMSITGSSVDQQFYYYFYDWKIKLPETSCISERVPVFIDYNFNTNNDDIEHDENIQIYPNPSSGIITVEMDNPVGMEANISVVDIAGKQILNLDYGILPNGKTIKELNLSHLSKGVYHLRIQASDQVHIRKIILQ